MLECKSFESIIIPIPKEFEKHIIRLRDIKSKSKKIFKDKDILKLVCKELFIGKNYRFVSVEKDFLLVSPNKKLLTNIDVKQLNLYDYFEKELISLFNHYGLDIGSISLESIVDIYLLKNKIIIKF